MDRIESGDAEVNEEVVISAPADVVWEALVEPRHRRRWWSYLDLDPVVGSRFTERWTTADGSPMVTSGTVVEVAPERRLRLTWADADCPEPTDVEISLSPAPEGTVVRVRHGGFGNLPDGRRLAAEHGAGWRTHLSNLRAVAEDFGWQRGVISAHISHSSPIGLGAGFSRSAANDRSPAVPRTLRAAP